MADGTHLLLVDDDSTTLDMLRKALTRRAYTLETAESVDEALGLLRARSFDAILTDLKMPGKSGIDLLRDCTEYYPDIPVILLTAHGTVETAVEALKLGAADYLQKPIRVEELALMLKRVLSYTRLQKENSVLRMELESRQEYLLTSENPEVSAILKVVEDFKDLNTTVLLQGESGTGKEVFSRYIHKASNRAQENFIALNCGAIPESLIESELFGFEKGAFTDARQAKKGKLELADRGTLLLDEINELSLKAQVALLRFIQEREIMPIGSEKHIRLDVRIVAATNRNLKQLVKEGRFREDLYYRINVLPIQLPPLRERTEDLIPLAEWFIRNFALKYNRQVRSLTPASITKLRSYAWPGNIRELRNCIERAVILQHGEEITPDSLLLGSETVSEPSSFEWVGEGGLRALERSYIEWLLRKNNNNKTVTAEFLNITPRALRYKLNSYED